MRITKLRMENFMPFGGEHVVQFPHSDTRSLVIIWGRNEHGKSTILNAVRWVLYSEALGRHRRKFPWAKMVNRDRAAAGQWGMKVVLEFVHDGRAYVLSRQIKPRELVTTPKSNEDFVETVQMTVDGTPLPLDRIKMTLGRIMPEAISRFHLFDGELLQEYEELIGSETQQVREIRSAIEDILGIPALLLGREEIGGLLKDARKVQAREVQKSDDSNDAAARQIETQDKIEAAHRDLLAQEEEIAGLEEEIDRIDDLLEAKARELNRQDEIDGLQLEIKGIQESLQELRRERATRLSTVWRDLMAKPASQRVSDLQSTISKREDVLLALGATRERLDIKQALSRGDDCPSCGLRSGLPVAPAEIDRLEQERQRLEAALQSGHGDLTRLSVLAKLQPTGDVDAISSLERRIAKQTVEAQRVAGRIADLKQEVTDAAGSEAQQQRAKQKELIKLVGRLSDRRDGIHERIEELQELEDELSKIMSRSESEEAKRANLAAQVLTEMHELFKRAVDGHRQRLLQDVENEASRRFLTLTATDGYTGLRINPNYGLSIIDHEGRAVDLRSSGAEQVVALSLIQALGKLSAADATLIIDTPFGRLDPQHRKNILEQMPNFGGQVILLAHEGELDPKMAVDVAGHEIASELLIQRDSPSQSKVTSWRST